MEIDDPVKQPAPQQAVRKWQFSLRETVMATAAIAAIFALVMQNQPGRTSLMAQQLDPSATLSRVINDNNLPGRASKSSGRASSSGASISRDFIVRLNGVSDLDTKGVLMPALKAEIQDAIIAEGYDITSRGNAGSKNASTQEWERLSSFAFGYKGFRISGRLRVFTCYGKDGDPMLIITLDES